MRYLGSWKIDDLLTFRINTHHPTTGIATDADAAPTYRIYEDETSTPIVTGTMALLDSVNTDGYYSEQITLSAASGFEKGKSYGIRISATVNSVTQATDLPFQIESSVDVISISGDSVAANNLELDYDGTGYNKANSTIGTLTTNSDKTGYSISGTKTTLDALNDISTAQVNTEVDNALNTAIPVSPTADSINERVKAIDDKLPVGNISDFDNTTDQVIVVTNNDKTGYGLSAAAVQTIWDALTSAMVTVGSIGKKLADWVLGSDNKNLISSDIHTSGQTIAGITGTKNTFDDLNDVSTTQVNTEVDTALSDISLDHLISNGTAVPTPTLGTFVDQLFNKDGSQTFSPATDSLEALSDKSTALQTDITTILTDTDELQSLGVKLSTQGKADVNAEVDSALDTAIPITPTTDSINERIKAIDDKLPTGNISDFDNTTDQVIIATNNDKTGYSISGTKTTLDALNDISTTQVNTEVDTALSDISLDHLISNGTAVPTPTLGTLFDQVMNKDASQTFSPATDSLEAIRDRGDAAWLTGGGGSITDILNVHPIIPTSIDLADTATVRLTLMLTNAVDDLPSIAEITPGTISIDRKAIGGTSWSAVVTDAACSEDSGQIYYDEVFNSGSGYAEGDSIRITFKSQKITVSANDYEITNTNGVIFQTEIRQTSAGGGGSTWSDAEKEQIRYSLGVNGTKTTSVGGLVNDIWDKAVNIAPNIRKNIAFGSYLFRMVDINNPNVGKTGLSSTIVAEKDIDGGGYVSCEGIVYEVGYGIYYINLTANDTNGDRIVYRFSDTNAKTTLITVTTIT